VITVAMPRAKPPSSVEESVKRAGEEMRPPQEVLSSAKQVLSKCGLPPKSIQGEELEIEAELPAEPSRPELLQAVAVTIVNHANRVLRRRSGVLLLGAAGVGKAQHGTANKAIELGPIATTVLADAKCTVTLCKQNTIADDGPL
jgi:nucleotide-binding universal stress UspA family protein